MVFFSFRSDVFNETASLLFRRHELPLPLVYGLLIKQLQVLKHVSFVITIIFRNKLGLCVI